jgi:hypothetical protein
LCNLGFLSTHLENELTLSMLHFIYSFFCKTSFGS